MSRYYYRQRKKAIRVAAAIAKIKARDEEILAALKEVLAHKERYLSDEELYLKEIPYCGCGTVRGRAFFPAGTMLECWENCPEFTLPDGFKIIKWGGRLSFSAGSGFNPETGEIRDYRYDPSFPKWYNLWDASLPYREKALGILRKHKPIPEEPYKDGYALYIHGLGSGANSGTCSLFASYFSRYEWHCPEVNEDPEESEAIIRKYIESLHPKMIVGTSMGGLYTLYSDAPDAVKVVVNPTVGIEQVLRKIGYGKHKFFCEREDGRTEYELNETVVRKFTTYKSTHQIRPGTKNLAVFSSNDDLAGKVESLKNARTLKEAGFTVIWSDKFGRRLKWTVARKIPQWLKML